MLYADTAPISSYTSLHSAHTVALSAFADILAQSAERLLAQGGLSLNDQDHIANISHAVVDALCSAVETAA